MGKRNRKTKNQFVSFTRIEWNELSSQGVSVFRHHLYRKDNLVRESYMCLGECYNPFTGKTKKCPYSAKLSYTIGDTPDPHQKLKIIKSHNEHPPVPFDKIQLRRILSNIHKKQKEQNKVSIRNHKGNPMKDNDTMPMSDNSSHTDNTTLCDNDNMYEKDIYTTGYSQQSQTEKEEDGLNTTEEYSEEVVDINQSIVHKQYITKSYEASFTICSIEKEEKEEKEKEISFCYSNKYLLRLKKNIIK